MNIALMLTEQKTNIPSWRPATMIKVHPMALYQSKQHVTETKHNAFDVQHSPGHRAPNAGIYRCMKCGHEIGIAQGHILPPEHHLGHPPGIPIVWQMLVFAQHNKA